jgi:tol-pal system protein YbgF
MKIIRLLIIALLPLYAFGENQIIKSQNLKAAANSDYENRLDEQEQEIRRLLGKVEVLEHKVSTITRQLNIADSSRETAEMPSTYGHPDVFDVSSLEEIDALSPEAPKTDHKDVASDKQTYDLALASFKDGKFVEAEKKFAEFIQKYPDSTMTSNAYFWYGESFFKRKNFSAAAVNYLKCYKQSPKGPKASDGLLKLALSLGELKKTQEACNILGKLDKEFPSNRTSSSKKAAEDARLKLGCKKSN